MEGTTDRYSFRTEEERRRLFGYVEQSFHMVPGTVGDQITLFDKRITECQIREAAELLQKWEK